MNKKGEVEMSNWLRKLGVIATLCCLTFIQPMQSITPVSKTPVTESVITASDHSADISIAEITAPTTFPIQDERKADSTSLEVGEVALNPLPYLETEPPQITSLASAGFLYVRQCQSSYLPIYF